MFDIRQHSGFERELSDADILVRHRQQDVREIKRGDTIDFYLSPTRNAKAAKRFLGKALRGLKDWEKPTKLNTDKAPSYGVATTELKREGKLGQETVHRQGKYLNNVIEADHGKLKMRIKPVRGFKSMPTAYATTKGFEVMRRLIIAEQPRTRGRRQPLQQSQSAAHAGSSTPAPDSRARYSHRSPQDHIPPQPTDGRSFVACTHRAIFALKAIEHLIRWRRAPCIGVCKTTPDRGIERSQAGFPILDQPYAFAQNLAFRVVSARRDETGDKIFKLLSEIRANHNQAYLNYITNSTIIAK